MKSKIGLCDNFFQESGLFRCEIRVCHGADKI